MGRPKPITEGAMHSEELKPRTPIKGPSFYKWKRTRPHSASRGGGEGVGLIYGHRSSFGTEKLHPIKHRWHMFLMFLPLESCDFSANLTNIRWLSVEARCACNEQRRKPFISKTTQFFWMSSFGLKEGGGCRWKKPKEDTSSFIRKKTAPYVITRHWENFHITEIWNGL